MIYLLFMFLFGLVMGSYLSAYTYRLGINKSVKDGRSFCPKCKEKIVWYDNIPLLSYLLLKGKCRNCGKSISMRYPLIEVSTASMFSLIFYFYGNCSGVFSGQSFKENAVCYWTENLGNLTVPFLLITSFVIIAIFVIDYERMIIPDELVFLLVGISSLTLILSSANNLYLYLFSSFSVSLFLLCLNLITKGKGMGLGDVKLAIAGGLVLGWQNSLFWIVSSFVIGAIVGIALLYKGKAKLGKQIPFGPFMVVGFFLSLFFGNNLSNYFFPYL